MKTPPIRQIGRPKKPKDPETSLSSKINLSSFNALIASYTLDLQYQLEEEDCPKNKQIYIEQFFKQDIFI